MKKRITSVLLALCLCAALLPTTAQAVFYTLYDCNSAYDKEPVVFHVSSYVMAALKSDNSLWTWGGNSKELWVTGKGL